MFEIAYTELAIEHATEEDIEKMDDAIGYWRSIEEWCSIRNGPAFHRAVLESTKNPRD